jgi:hypothetical protein
MVADGVRASTTDDDLDQATIDEYAAGVPPAARAAFGDDPAGRDALTVLAAASDLAALGYLDDGSDAELAGKLIGRHAVRL